MGTKTNSTECISDVYMVCGEDFNVFKHIKIFPTKHHLVYCKKEILLMLFLIFLIFLIRYRDKINST